MMHEFRLPACENTASLTNPDDCDIHEAVRFVHSCIFFFTENLGCLVHSVFDRFFFLFFNVTGSLDTLSNIPERSSL
jgi:hypothetical protein